MDELLKLFTQEEIDAISRGEAGPFFTGTFEIDKPITRDDFVVIWR